MRASSASATCEQNFSSVNNMSSIPSSTVSSKTRPKRYSRIVSSLLRDLPIAIAVTQRCNFRDLCNCFQTHALLDANLQLLLCSHNAHAHCCLSHLHALRNALMHLNLFRLCFGKIIKEQGSILGRKFLQASIQTLAWTAFLFGSFRGDLYCVNIHVRSLFSQSLAIDVLCDAVAISDLAFDFFFARF